MKVFFFLLSMASIVPALHAQVPPDDDLSRLPPNILVAPSPHRKGASSVSGRMFVDTTISAIDGRADPVFGLKGTGGSTALTALDMIYMWKLPTGLSATVSDRLIWQYFRYTGASPNSNTWNELRESYISWRSPTGVFYADAGRVNVRNGIALGWNPTDYFAAGSSTPQASADPSAVRDNRLGTAMVNAQYLWNGGSFSIAAIPKLGSPPPLDKTGRAILDPALNLTNTHNRVLLTLGFSLADLSPQVLAYGGSGQALLGLNLSRPIGNRVVVYGEWSGGTQQDIAERAWEFAHDTGSLPASLPELPNQTTGSHYRNDAVLGASWVIASKLTLNVEYDYHGSGLSHDELRQAQDAAHAAPATFGRQWLYLREFAHYQEEPLVRKQWFVRLAANKAFVRKLDLSAFAFIDAYDGSLFTQFQADYHLSDKASLKLLVSRYVGGRISEYGSVPTASTIALEFIGYL